jgi:hypothetical protein
MILAAATNYAEAEVRPFALSLARSGYQGELALVAPPHPEWKCLDGLRVTWISPSSAGAYQIGNGRFLAFCKLLERNAVPKQLLVCDLRDLVFQSNPETGLPDEGLHVFCEHSAMTIGKCPYNSGALRACYGDKALADLAGRSIICSGTFCGGGAAVTAYLDKLWGALVRLPATLLARTMTDQVTHALLCYTGNVGAVIHGNEDGPIYTVGYMPRESLLPAPDGWLRNRAGLPCIVHQYDRHVNLTAHYRRMFA